MNPFSPFLSYCLNQYNFVFIFYLCTNSGYFIEFVITMISLICCLFLFISLWYFLYIIDTWTLRCNYLHLFVRLGVQRRQLMAHLTSLLREHNGFINNIISEVLELKRTKMPDRSSICLANLYWKVTTQLAISTPIGSITLYNLWQWYIAIFHFWICSNLLLAGQGHLIFYLMTIYWENSKVPGIVTI